MTPQAMKSLCLVLFIIVPPSRQFVPTTIPTVKGKKNLPFLRAILDNDDQTTTTSTYETSDTSSKTLVSSLTNLINFVTPSSKEERPDKENINRPPPPPKSPDELLERIKEDYTVKNYLWTGDIHKPAFEDNCRFTDPTLSFEGTDKFTSNVQNLRVIVDYLIAEGECKSDLLDIKLNRQEGYVQSRWNMVGELKGLFWNPKIDVIGNTKFWYRKVDDNDKEESDGLRVYFYDEEWEIPVNEALLQLITPN